MTIRRAISPLILAAFLSCGELHAQSAPVPARSETASPTPTVSQADELQQLRQERDVAQIRADLIANQTNWFAILVSVLMSGFSLLVAGVVIFFTFRFGNAAVAEARQGIAEERERIQKLLDEANADVARIRESAQTAGEITAGLKPGEAPANEADEQTLRKIARRAEAKPVRERTLDEYRALVSVAAIDEDWEALERRASAMVLLFEDADDEQIAFALLSLGIARGRLERPIEAITPLDDLLRRFGESVRPELQIWMASALRNKGVALGMLDRQVEEIAAYDEVLCRYGASDSSALQERVANAMFSLACVHARRSAVPECIAALLRWRERRGSLDREKIASDTDFDGVRSHPDFVAFLSENGCPPSPPQPNAHSVAKKP